MKISILFKKSSLTILIFTLSLFSCKKDANVDLSGTYELQLNKPKNIPINSNGATIIAVDITDSRCPINANCTTSGSASVKILIKDSKQSQALAFCIGDCSTTKKFQITNILLNDTYYSIQLENVTPYAAPATATKTAVIKISKDLIYN